LKPDSQGLVVCLLADLSGTRSIVSKNHFAIVPGEVT
jgi:hypothetical protein